MGVIQTHKEWFVDIDSLREEEGFEILEITSNIKVKVPHGIFSSSSQHSAQDGSNLVGPTRD